ncbi:MAG: zinc ribbon domain-containing protein, partial [Bacillota bacterium]|nr:zinc ribbon domain-containing protein [Bacillota bacterium]
DVKGGWGRAGGQNDKRHNPIQGGALMKVMPNEETSQIETSRAERVLAIAMVIFLLIGGAWVFRQIQLIPARPDYSAIEARYISPELRQEHGLAQTASWEAHSYRQKIQEELRKATLEHEFRREEYRVMLDKGIKDPVREAAYLGSLAAFERRQTDLELALEVEQRALENLALKQAPMNVAYERISIEHNQLNTAFEWKLFMIRIAYAVPVFLLALLAFTHMRRRGSNYLIFGTALIGFASFQLIFLFGLYSWHLLRDVAQIAISLMGTALSIGGIIVIRRHLVDPTRVSKSRMRKGLCPGCGTPAGEHSYCGSCGEQLQKQCTHCHDNRPVGAEYCPHCGGK